MASGIRISFNFNGCTGPLTVATGAREAFHKALTNSGLTILHEGGERFPDDSTNLSADLSESHVVAGTYPKDDHLEGTVSVCHEDRDNTDKAWGLVIALSAAFHPTRGIELEVRQWKSQ